MFITVICFILIFTGTISHVGGSGVQCKDEENNNVDWFIIYKLPRITSNGNSNVKQGTAYAYITNLQKSQWILSRTSIEDKNSMLGLTMAPLYSKKEGELSKLIYWVYNDYSKNGQGHTKGVVMADMDGGFWLPHNVPNYTPDPSKTAHVFPDNGKMNGHNMMCITLNQAYLEILASIIYVNENWTIASSRTQVIPQLQKTYPNLVKASYNGLSCTDEWSKTGTILSAGRQIFTVIAKSGQRCRDQSSTRTYGRASSMNARSSRRAPSSQRFQRQASVPDLRKYCPELYGDLVATHLTSSLMAQTWPKLIVDSQGRTTREQPTSTCSNQYRVEVVREVNVAGVTFNNLIDHSKWAASSRYAAMKGQNTGYVCIGDLNMNDEQKKRGGGAVCIKDNEVWSLYVKTATKIENCP